VLVSIIIPAYNAERTLGECLDGCLAQGYPNTEVIVVDDGSTDGTERVARARNVGYIRQENGGPAKARNTGAREAEGEIIAFTDSDCIPEANWIEALIETFDAESRTRTAPWRGSSMRKSRHATRISAGRWIF
jgi:glycosyltransferase involved in cell wall biosynthesis